MRKFITIDSIAVAFIGAIGYGVGYNLPNKFNVHPIISIICCLVLGTSFDFLAEKILSCSFFEKSRKNKIITAIYVYIGYLISWIIVDKTLNYDLDIDFLTNIEMIMVIQVVLLIIKSLKKSIKNRINDNKKKGTN